MFRYYSIVGTVCQERFAPSGVHRKGGAEAPHSTLAEVDDELVEGEGFFGVDGRSEDGVGDGVAVGFGLVEGGGADDFGGDFEIIDFVGKAVGGQRRRLVHELEVQMGDD